MKKLTLDHFLNYRFLGNLQISPDEGKYAFVSAQAHYYDNAYHNTLYLGENGRPRKLRKIKKNNKFLFLDNKRLIINLQKSKKEENALKESFNQSHYLYDFEDKTLEKAFTLPFPAELEARVNDHVLLLSASMKEEDHILYEGTKEQRETYLKEKKRGQAFEDIDEIPYYFNGRDFVTDQNKQLFLYDLDTDTVKPVVTKDFSVGTHVFSDDKKTLYYTGRKKEKVMRLTSRIYAYHVEEDTHTTVYDKTDYNIAKLICIGDALIAAAKDMRAYGINQNPDFFRVEDGTLDLLAKHGETIGNTVGSDCRLLGSNASFVKDDRFYFITTIDDHSEIRSVGLDGSMHTHLKMEGAIDGFQKWRNEAVMIGMKNQDLQEIHAFDFNKETTRQLSNLNKTVLKDRYVATPQTVVFAKENHEVKGFVLLPEDYSPDKQYPAILNIHGGPKTVYGSIYYHEMQYWANEGYVVLFANPRGSDGKGDDFADIRGKYGTIDYEDLMDFTDRVLDTYAGIDRERLFVTGGSYGGFMTNWMVTQTDRFKAAATQRSISNWLSFYGTSDIGYYFATDQTGGHPIMNRDKLYDQSPIKYVMDVKTPLLFIHADKDHRCPIEQAQQFYAILKTNGLDTKLIWFKGENHELSRGGKPQARVKRLREITDWFKRYS